MNPQYRINVKGGTPEENAKWSKEVSVILSHVEDSHQKLKKERLDIINSRIIADAIASKRR